ncbi:MULTISPECIES: hypothetical protein [Tenacibaculum]|uniref:hypothetical protein n=1 Tax=Tenacibaculum TaxID=104267 RepID=UPI00089CF836|nr:MULTISPECIES: hypothetical protein [unclassified Tenacibaculum]RBW54683.1 hypothetical protein DS884_17185 [Tenacibaculum sp. E3R01]SEE14025.1 hypothetical protein SAMN04487765_1534 [Tenacibaculum sp. MAR_2010_89]
MTNEIDTIKENIYDKIAEINDENVLIAIQTIIVNIENSREDKITNKEDFTSYIKEWVKNM